MHLFLCGFMGCGKTFWGKQLAAAYQVPFLDLDQQIEEAEQMSIARYFETQGETIFREIERFYLHGLTKMAPSVVAVGGGTPCFYDNIDWMNQHGHTVYLKTEPDILVQRLLNETDKRPLLKDLNSQELYDRIFYMLMWREPFYQKAHQSIEMREEHLNLEYLFGQIDWLQRMKSPKQA